jgi:hypothetical protein
MRERGLRIEDEDERGRTVSVCAPLKRCKAGRFTLRPRDPTTWERVLGIEEEDEHEHEHELLP